MELDLNARLKPLIEGFAPLAGKKLLVGFSGGPDSILVLNLAAMARERYGFQVYAAHLNHGWRPEAYSEEEFAMKACQGLGVQFFVANANDFQVPWNGSKEAQAREMRQSFFASIVAQEAIDYVVLGHNKTDQAETFFIRLVRGSSIDGLSCMEKLTDSVFRPILGLEKTEVLQLCQALGLAYCTDVSNNDLCFLRNKIRHKLLPVFTELDARGLEKLCQTVELLQTENEFLKKMAIEHYKQNTDVSGFLPTREFLSLDRVLAMRVLKELFAAPGLTFSGHFSRGLFDEVYRFLGQNKSPKHRIANIVVVKSKGRFSIVSGS